MNDESIVTVRADDLGMHPAIDAAIFSACELGSVQEVAWLAVGPSAGEAARICRALPVSVSVHVAYASEWDRVKWSSLTGRIDGPDGALPLSPGDLAGIPGHLLIAEGVAQISRARDFGLNPHSFNFHIDAPTQSIAAGIETLSGLQCRDIGSGARPQPPWFQSFFDLSSHPCDQKLAGLLDFIRCHPAGRRCAVAHPGFDRRGLDDLCSPALGDRNRWAVEFRVSDAQILTDPSNAAAIRDALARARAYSRA